MKLVKVNDFSWEIPKHDDMNVPVVVNTSANLLDNLSCDRTLQQAKNVACLNGVLQKVYVMPDAHQGYGFPIGGVAAFDMDEGIISPGGVGYDINCGVRLLRTDFVKKDIQGKIPALLNEIFHQVPAGVGKESRSKLDKKDLEQVCVKGAEWAVENGCGDRQDLEKTEEYGKMKRADFKFLSKRAIERGTQQLGTLGAGNHFIEIQEVSKIYNKDIADVFGIVCQGQILVMIHCGSRGFGHQVATDYMHLMRKKIGTKALLDKELIHAPIQSELGKQYYMSMSAAVNFAFANRQMIAHRVRKSFDKIMGSFKGMNQVYDVCHNVAKFEYHIIDGKKQEVCIHRKGATRSFGPGREEIPLVYRSVGQPVIIPGSMGTASYILVGTKAAEALSFGSTSHGAGRAMSRHEALKRFKSDHIKNELAKQGIDIQAASLKGVAEEAPGAYKNVDDVVAVSHKAGIGELVAKVVPLGVIKG